MGQSSTSSPTATKDEAACLLHTLTLSLSLSLHNQPSSLLNQNTYRGHTGEPKLCLCYNTTRRGLNSFHKLRSTSRCQYSHLKLLFNGHHGSSQEVNRPGVRLNITLFSEQVKTNGATTTLCLHSFMACTVDIFNFCLYLRTLSQLTKFLSQMTPSRFQNNFTS